MSKINFYKFSNQTIKTKKIKNIVGDSYLQNYKSRMQICDNIRRQQQKTIYLSDRIMVGQFCSMADKENMEHTIESLDNDNKSFCLIKKIIK